MLLTLTSSAAAPGAHAGTEPGSDASDLGYLLHKHPDKVQTFSLPFGEATVFYPEATAERCTAALLLEVDPVGLVRGKKGGGAEGFALAQYVNDRPYAASSLLAVAMGRVYRTALSGRCDARPDLVDIPLTLHIHIPALPARASAGGGGPSGAALVHRLFDPLGWRVEATEIPLAGEGAEFDWGSAPYVDTHLRGEIRLADALSHLYVLLPVLDDSKHYWVGPDEVDKLVRHGHGWLAEHPLRDLITRRYLAAQRSYVRDATSRLDELDDRPEPERPEDTAPDHLTATGSAPGSTRGADRPDSSGHFHETTPLPGTPVMPGAPARTGAPPLKALRREAVLDALHDVGARRVVDLGCGEGYHLQALLADATFTEIVGVDVSASILNRAEKRLDIGRLSDRQRERPTLRQSSLTYRDDALVGYDAVLLVEVIEHVELDRIPSLERNVFGFARPRSVIVTTPDADYNSHYGLGEHEMRHPDHRFEWTRSEFEAWAHRVADEYGYSVSFRPVGGPEGAAPTQMAVFTQQAAS
ncbi:MAG: 3' terminal RNA ribose 2'-O-methyltransferase Hen1 [Dermatophilus congolensis]|nr:3' terminal RNA ribose 2'-O-methyltransferase Hen1 [Dermatophilus congolensis]